MLWRRGQHSPSAAGHGQVSSPGNLEDRIWHLEAAVRLHQRLWAPSLKGLRGQPGLGESDALSTLRKKEEEQEEEGREEKDALGERLATLLRRPVEASKPADAVESAPAAREPVRPEPVPPEHASESLATLRAEISAQVIRDLEGARAALSKDINDLSLRLGSELNTAVAQLTDLRHELSDFRSQVQGWEAETAAALAKQDLRHELSDFRSQVQGWEAETAAALAKQDLRHELSDFRSQVQGWEAETAAALAKQDMRHELSDFRSQVQGWEAETAAALAKQAEELDRLATVACRCCQKPSVAAGPAHQDLKVSGPRVEWLVRDVPALLQKLPRGQALESTPFSVEVPGVGLLKDLQLCFFPNGGPDATGYGMCSLRLRHPPSMPWVHYELSVGQAVRGTFDTIFGGEDNFCYLAAELAEEDDSTVLLGLRFLAENQGGWSGPDKIRARHPRPWKSLLPAASSNPVASLRQEQAGASSPVQLNVHILLADSSGPGRPDAGETQDVAETVEVLPDSPSGSATPVHLDA